MPRRKDELSPHEVAKRCSVDRATVYRWVAKAEDGAASPVTGHTRRDQCGRIWIRRKAIDDDPSYF
jgi:transposase-like protein